jgi:branched-chain amino acid aminotransferase
MLDSSGCAAEGSGENLFVVHDGAITTPDLTNILPGITRDTVITLAREAGYPVREGRITRDAIYVADEAFFSGTAAEVTPIRELDGRAIGTGKPGPITKRLQKSFFDQAHGRNEAHSDWLTVLSGP